MYMPIKLDKPTIASLVFIILLVVELRGIDHNPTHCACANDMSKRLIDAISIGVL